MNRGQNPGEIERVRSFAGSPAIVEDRVALLKDDDGDPSIEPLSSSKNHSSADDVRFESCAIVQLYQNGSDIPFNVRETGRLGLEFGILWVNLCFPELFIVG